MTQYVAAQDGESSPAAIRKYRDAAIFQRQGDYEFAVTEWNEFLDRYPEDPLAPDARHYLGVCYFNLQKYAEARNAFEKALATGPNKDLADQTHLNLALAYYNLAQAGQGEALSKAIEHLQTVAKEFPSSPHVPKALFYLGEALYLQQKLPEAIAAYSAVVEKHPKSDFRADALYALGVTQEEAKRFDEAGRTYDQLLKEFPKHPKATEVGMRRGETLFAAAKLADAEQRFAAAAAKQDFELADHATLRLAETQYQQKKYREAAETYASIPARFKDSQYAQAATLAAGNTYYLAGDLDTARRYLDQVVAAGGPAAAEAAHWIARIHLKKGQPAEALQVVEAVLPRAEQSPQLVNLLMDQADATYEISERRQQAAQMYAAVADKFPQDPQAAQARYLAALTSLKVGDYGAALQQAEAFQSAHAGHELAADVRYIAAESRLLRREYAAAAELYHELLAKHEKHADAPSWRLRLALALQLDGKHQQVVELLQPRAEKFSGPDQRAEALHLLGVSQLELGQFDAAAKSLKGALAAQADWRQADETLLALSRAYRGQNNLKPAMEAVQQLIQQHPGSRALDRAHFRLAEYAYAAGDYRTADENYRLVLKNFPQSSLAPHALSGLGWTELAKQDYAAAEKTFSELIEKHPDHELAARASYARGSARQQLGNLQGAQQDAEAYVQTAKEPSARAEGFYLLGLTQVGQKQHQAAAKSFNAVLEASPEFSAADKAKYEIAWALKSGGDDAGAAAAFARLTAEHPQSPLAAEAWFHVGEHQYHQEKNYKQAAVAYFKAQKLAEKSEIDEKSLHKLAWSYYQQEDFDGAQKTFRSQVYEYPQGSLAADGLLMAAESMFKLGDEKHLAALELYEKALARPELNDAYRQLALLHAAQAAAQGQLWDRGLKLLEQLQSAYPKSEYRHEALFQEAAIYQETGKFGPAKERYAIVADEHLGELGARARFMLGELYFAEKNYKEAVRHFFKVAYGYPDSSEELNVWKAAATFEAAQSFRSLQNADRAAKLYQEVIDLFPNSDKAPLAKKELAALKK